MHCLLLKSLRILSHLEKNCKIVKQFSDKKTAVNAIEIFTTLKSQRIVSHFEKNCKTIEYNQIILIFTTLKGLRGHP